MRKVVPLALLLSTALYTPAVGQVGLPFPGPGGVASPAIDCNVGGYFGPGDCAPTGVVAWYGLRAFSAAAAAAHLKAIQVESASHTAERCDILLATGGGLGVTANPSGGSCTDTGLAFSTFCTSNADCTVKFRYDQTGHAHHVAITTTGSVLSVSPLKIIQTGQCYDTTSAGSAKVSIPQPATVSYVAKRTTVVSSFDMLFGFDGGISETGFGASGSLSIYAGSAIANATEAEGTQIATQSTFDGANSVEYVNGSSLSLSANPGAGSSAVGDITVGCSEDLGHAFTGDWWESGIWQGTAADHINFPYAAMNINQHNYWGFFTAEFGWAFVAWRRCRRPANDNAQNKNQAA